MAQRIVEQEYKNIRILEKHATYGRVTFINASILAAIKIMSIIPLFSLSKRKPKFIPHAVPLEWASSRMDTCKDTKRTPPMYNIRILQVIIRRCRSSEIYAALLSSLYLH